MPVMSTLPRVLTLARERFGLPADALSPDDDLFDSLGIDSVPGSITLNTVVLTDIIDLDAGELDTSGAPTVVVRLGNLIQANGVQTVIFQVTID